MGGRQRDAIEYVGYVKLRVQEEVGHRGRPEKIGWETAPSRESVVCRQHGGAPATWTARATSRIGKSDQSRMKSRCTLRLRHRKPEYREARRPGVGPNHPADGSTVEEWGRLEE